MVGYVMVITLDVYISSLWRQRREVCVNLMNNPSIIEKRE